MAANLQEWTDAIAGVEAVLKNRTLKGRKRTCAIIDAMRELGWKSPSEVREEVFGSIDD